MRYFADGPVTLKAIGTGLAGMDPQYKIDAGELMYGKELLGELEICSAGSDLFNEDLGAKIGELERNGTPAARSVVGGCATRARSSPSTCSTASAIRSAPGSSSAPCGPCCRRCRPA